MSLIYKFIEGNISKSFHYCKIANELWDLIHNSHAKQFKARRYVLRRLLYSNSTSVERT